MNNPFLVVILEGLGHKARDDADALSLQPTWRLPFHGGEFLSGGFPLIKIFLQKGSVNDKNQCDGSTNFDYT